MRYPVVRLSACSVMITIPLTLLVSSFYVNDSGRSPFLSRCIVDAFVLSKTQTGKNSYRLFNSQSQGKDQDTTNFDSTTERETLLLEWNQNDTKSVATRTATPQPTTLTSTTSSVSAQFGDVIPLKRPMSVRGSTDGKDDFVSFVSSSTSTSSSGMESSTTAILDPQSLKRRNFGVALLSISLAIMNYLWQYLHPLEPIQLLYQMEQKSSPITVIGTTNKPTVVDFWAPWCENCKLLAPTLLQIEEEYGKDVNFVMINGDESSAWPLIEAFGVDAIPHLALVEADGTVDTALIGPVPKQWLEKDLQVLIENAKIINSESEGSIVGTVVDGSGSSSSSSSSKTLRPLPYQMLDVFANRPDERRIQVQKVSLSSTAATTTTLSQNQ